MSSILKFVLKVCLTLLCLYIVYKKIDVDVFLKQIESLTAGTLLSGILIFLTHLFVVGVRWQHFVKELGANIGLWRATKLVAIGSFFNQAFFGTIAGDATRIIYLRNMNSSLTAAFGSVLLDRYMAVLTMWICVIFAVPFLDVEIIKSDAAAGGILGVCLGGIALLGLPIVHWFSFVFSFGAMAIFRRTFEFVVRLAKAFRNSHKSLDGLFAIYGTSAFIIVSSSVVTWLVGADLNTNLSFIHCLLITPIALLISAIPITIGGWGLRELSFVTLLGLLSIGPESSLLISLTFGMLVLVSSIIGGVFWLIDERPK